MEKQKFILKPGMKVCIKRTARKHCEKIGFVKRMSYQLGLYGKISDIWKDSTIYIGIYLWPISCIDKSKPIIDLNGNKIYVQRKELVI